MDFLRPRSLRPARVLSFTNCFAVAKVNATIASGNECNSSFKLTHVLLLSCHFFPVLCERSCFRRVSEAKSDRGCRRQPAGGEGAGGTATDLNLSSGGSSSGPAP